MLVKICDTLAIAAEDVKLVVFIKKESKAHIILNGASATGWKIPNMTQRRYNKMIKKINQALQERSVQDETGRA